MTTQPEALRLADALDAHQFDEPHAAAAELRRLYEENQRLRGIVPEVLERLNDELCEENERLEAQRDALLEALRDLVDAMTGRLDGETIALHNALIVLAKAEENT